MDCSLPGSSVHGILQARILEWVAIPFSKGCSQPTDRTQVSCIADGFFTIGAAREAQPGERCAYKYPAHSDPIGGHSNGPHLLQKPQSGDPRPCQACIPAAQLPLPSPAFPSSSHGCCSQINILSPKLPLSSSFWIIQPAIQLNIFLSRTAYEVFT